jgi:hypothetical protein
MEVSTVLGIIFAVLIIGGIVWGVARRGAKQRDKRGERPR